MKVARTVLRGGKTERSYLSQQKVAGSNPATLTVNILATSPKKSVKTIVILQVTMQKKKPGLLKSSWYFKVVHWLKTNARIPCKECALKYQEDFNKRGLLKSKKRLVSFHWLKTNARIPCKECALKYQEDFNKLLSLVPCCASCS